MLSPVLTAPWLHMALMDIVPHFSIDYNSFLIFLTKKKRKDPQPCWDTCSSFHHAYPYCKELIGQWTVRQMAEGENLTRT